MIPVLSPHAWLPHLMWKLGTIPAILTLVIANAPLAFRAVFGREMIMGTLCCDASYESTPDASNAEIITLHPPDEISRTAHAIYQYVRVPPTIIDWIGGKLTNPHLS
jgi:hypothetical protein